MTGSLAQQAHASYVTSFVGRETEITEVVRAIVAGRVLTLVGPGGSGKTRLALEAISSMPDRRATARWIDLSNLRDPELVVGQIARALNVQEGPPGDPLGPLVDATATMESLLVFDNCEHVIERLREVLPPLLSSQGTAAVATSREAIGLTAEQVFVVPPLGHRSVDASDNEAVRLFIERGVSARSGRPFNDGDRPTIETLCQRLDGLPLAIEIVASRAGALGVDDIMDRLSNRLDMTAHRSLHPRQRTLRSLIDWSHDLLSDDAKLLFRRFGVFRGGWDAVAAEAIVSDVSLNPEAIIDLTGELVRKSLLVMTEATGRARYRYLETIDSYVIDLLDATPDADAFRSRHRDYFLGLAERAEPHLFGGPDQMEWHDALEIEHDNLRGALRYSMEAEDRTPALRLCNALFQFWRGRGYVAEGRRWLAEGRAVAGRSPERVEVKALAVSGDFAAFQGADDEAQDFLEEALERGKQASVRGIGGAWFCLFNLGMLAARRRDEARSIELLTDAVAEARARDRQWTRWPLFGLGRALLSAGDLEAAEDAVVEALALHQRYQDHEGVAATLDVNALVAMERGDLDRAYSLAAESLAVTDRLAYPDAGSYPLDILGMIAIERGRPYEAHQRFTRALRTVAEGGRRAAVPPFVERMCWVAAATGHHELAAELMGASTRLRDDAATPATARESQLLAHYRGVLEEALDKEVLVTAAARGRALPRTEAIRLALSVPIEDTDRPAVGSIEPTFSTWKRQGEYWSISHDGRSIQLRDSKGMAYLATLLTNPHRRIHALALAAPISEAGAGPDPDLSSTGMGDVGPVLDADAKAAYKKRVADLRQEIEEAEGFNDFERANRHREELEFLVKELSAATGLGGRDRRTGSAAEKARMSVRKAIKSAITRVRQADPVLAAYLDSNVETGTYCSYSPDPSSEVRWKS